MFTPRHNVETFDILPGSWSDVLRQFCDGHPDYKALLFKDSRQQFYVKKNGCYIKRDDLATMTVDDDDTITLVGGEVKRVGKAMDQII